MMGLLSKIGDVLGGAFGLVDDLHTSDEERLALKAQLLTIQTKVVSEVIEAEKEMMQAQAKIIETEAASPHWLTSAWRPITMLTFLVLIVLAQLGVTNPVPPEMWPLLKLGLGGYVIGRSLEKTIPNVVTSLKAGEASK